MGRGWGVEVVLIVMVEDVLVVGGRIRMRALKQGIGWNV